MRAAEFVDLLVRHLKVDELWVGADFAMGYEREGNVQYLTEQGKDKGFTVQTVDLLQAENADSAISSTAIREAIESGNVDQAAVWLGRGHTVTGKVVHGQARGRTIGFPTANIEAWDQQVLPANGVYAGWATVDGQRHMAVTNVGIRPTFSGDYVTIESFIMDFSRDIYDQVVSISFEKRLRGEQKFENIQALMAQIRADADAGRAFLEAQS
jgi:riboflavin kinase/FMN adenylyltransferase